MKLSEEEEEEESQREQRFYFFFQKITRKPISLSYLTIEAHIFVSLKMNLIS